MVCQACNVFFSQWLSRLAHVVRWKCALAWVARSCLTAVHRRRVWVTPCMVYRRPSSRCCCRDPPRGGRGSGTHGEEPLPHLVAVQRGKVGEESQERVGSVYGDGAL